MTRSLVLTLGLLLALVGQADAQFFGFKNTDPLSCDGTKCTITSKAAGDVPLTVKGAVGQTAALAVFEDSAGTDLLTVGPANVTLASGRLNVPAGAIATPSIGTSAQTGSGIWFPSTHTVISANTIESLRVLQGSVRLSTSSLAWGVDGNNADLLLVRDDANTLAQRNAANAQISRIYNTFTDASNYERFEIQTVAAGATRLQQTQAGTGSARDLELRTVGSASLSFYTNNVIRWQVSAAGDLVSVDNTNNIGQATGNRPRSAYLGTSLLINTTVASALHADVTTAIGTPTLTSVTASGTGVLGLIRNGADTTATSLNFLKTRSATGSDADTAVASGDGAGLARAWVADGATYREITRIANDVDTFTAVDNVSGYIGLWTRNDGAAAVVTERLRVLKAGGLRWLNGTEPACAAGTRGSTVLVEGGVGVADTFRVCTKDAADAYAYRALF